jgi:hypothetical protein
MHPGMATTGSESAPKTKPSTGAVWTARILTAVPVFMLAMGGIMKLAQPPPIIDEFVGRYGYPQSSLILIGLLELACAIVYAIPRTAVLGAVLITGYIGGAITTHVRISDPAFIAPLFVALLAWAGLYLREPRLRAVLPLRK